MVVAVHFMGPQRTLTRRDRIQIRLPKESRVADLLACVKERYPALPFSEGVLVVTVNDRVSSLSKVLEPNDNISFLPFLGGG